MYGLRTSQWNYDTDATGGVGLGPLLASGGTIFLTDPSGQEQQFHYGGFGFGIGGGIRIPKMPEISLPKSLHLPREPAGTGSTVDFTSGGWVFLTGACHRDELKRSDLVGGTVYLDVGFGIPVDGVSASVMLLGLNSALLTLAVSMPQLPFFRIAVNAAPAILVMTGFNAGVQPGTLQNGTFGARIGWGAGVMLGCLH